MTAAAWPYVRTAGRRLVRERPADLIVRVHPLFIAPVIKALGENRAPFLSLATDLMTTHSLWYHRGVDLCLVPTEAAAQRALACGMRPNQVRVVGLPVARRFCQPRRDPAQLRQALGWPIDRPMVLVVGGGEGMAPVDRFPGLDGGTSAGRKRPPDIGGRGSGGSDDPRAVRDWR